MNDIIYRSYIIRLLDQAFGIFQRGDAEMIESAPTLDAAKAIIDGYHGDVK